MLEQGRFKEAKTNMGKRTSRMIYNQNCWNTKWRSNAVLIAVTFSIGLGIGIVFAKGSLDSFKSVDYNLSTRKC